MAVSREHIIAEIQRTAAENGGRPPGRARFQEATGIREGDVIGRYWSRWSDAIKEAGYQPNELQQPFPLERVLAGFADLVRSLGRFPTVADLKLRAREDVGFPSHNTFNRLGTRPERARRVLEYCEALGGFQDVAEICRPIAAGESTPEGSGESSEPKFGFVYLMKSGKYYKIGRSVCAEKRAYEVRLVLPEQLALMHKIKTDDPEGIEAYWHHRFRDRRVRGEWFSLSAQDVKTFRMRKFM